MIPSIMSGCLTLVALNTSSFSIALFLGTDGPDSMTSLWGSVAELGIVGPRVAFFSRPEETCAKTGWHPNRITAKTDRKVKVFLVKFGLAYWSEVFRVVFLW